MGVFNLYLSVGREACPERSRRESHPTCPDLVSGSHENNAQDHEVLGIFLGGDGFLEEVVVKLEHSQVEVPPVQLLPQAILLDGIFF